MNTAERFSDFWGHQATGHKAGDEPRGTRREPRTPTPQSQRRVTTENFPGTRWSPRGKDPPLPLPIPCDLPLGLGLHTNWGLHGIPSFAGSTGTGKPGTLGQRPAGGNFCHRHNGEVPTKAPQGARGANPEVREGARHACSDQPLDDRTAHQPLAPDPEGSTPTPCAKPGTRTRGPTDTNRCRTGTDLCLPGPRKICEGSRKPPRWG